VKLNVSPVINLLDRNRDRSFLGLICFVLIALIVMGTFGFLKIQNINDRLDFMESQISRLESDVSSLEYGQDSLSSDVSDLEYNYDDLRSDYLSVSRNIDTICYYLRISSYC
jgi:hypothetical protein